MTLEDIQDAQQAQEQGLAAATAKQSYPIFNSAADIDAYFMAQMERDAERDRAEQERRLNRQRIAQSMGDLGNILIDTIKASGGALVTPRDVTARYNQMDERAQQIYNNYRARMDLKNKYMSERAQQMRAADEAEKTRQHQLEMKQMDYDKAMDVAEQNNETKRAVAEMQARARVQAAREGASARLRVAQDKAGNQVVYVPFGGAEYAIDKNRYEGRMCSLYAYLKENNLFPDSAGADASLQQIYALMTSNNTSMADESSRWKLTSAVNVALQSIPADSPHAANIISILNGGSAALAKPAGNTAGSSSGNTTNSGNAGNSSNSGAQKQKKKIPGFGG